MVLTSTALASGKRMTSCGSETLQPHGYGLARALCYLCISRNALISKEDCGQTTCLGLIEGSPAALASAGPQDMAVALAAQQAP